jgi:hypothetical protein
MKPENVFETLFASFPSEKQTVISWSLRDKMTDRLTV